MPAYIIILIIIACVLLFVFLAFFALAYAIDRAAFGKRQDKNPKLKYFTAEELNISAEPVETHVNGITLRGFLYGGDKNDKQKLIIFCHGMGPGQIAYTKEIAYFCNSGYQVLAFDSEGCNFSDGKGVKGLYRGIQTAVAAIDFAKNDERLKGMPICLIGHSWGAYSVVCASTLREVEIVISMSAPDSPSQILAALASPAISKCLAHMLVPFWKIIYFFRFGKYGDAKASKCAEKSGARILLIHGDRDTTVNIASSTYSKARGANVKKLLAKDKAHNPYSSLAADKLTNRLLQTLLKKDKTAGDEEFLRAFDFDAATEEDLSFMQELVAFIEG